MSLPDMNRLLAVWDGSLPSATSLEHATCVMLTMWASYLDPANLGDRQPDGLASEATGLQRDIARVIDDEVTWHLGNRPDAVILVEDDLELVTVGDLVGRITMLVVFLDQWPPQQGECPAGPAFLEFGRRYDALTGALVARDRRQPRRRSHGAPPIAQPRRLELGIGPRAGKRAR
ncbi:hypothetical protein [Nocardia xishanensis]|uniref:hypothetical protein n=1 Tax=Nocardia xishanensis TaxID=238964 RepID=UPI0012F52968|nr:hypothetical protein [Nocardia xishanensis]